MVDNEYPKGTQWQQVRFTRVPKHLVAQRQSNVRVSIGSLSNWYITSKICA